VNARDASRAAVVGLLANPMAGRDVRRLAARASTTTLEIKRDQVTRAAVGAVAAGATRLLVAREPFRIATGALEHLTLDAEVEVLDVGAELKARDSARAVQAMRAAGCGALVVLGGDGTHRAVAKAWPDAPLVALSTGTNNVFPASIEATSAGAAAGLVASGRVALGDVATQAKCVRVEVEGEASDLALIDAVLLVDDAVGNCMPFDTARIRRVVLARSEPGAVGSSPIGGLVAPCGAEDDAGVEVTCVGADDGGRPLLVPIAPGLYRPVRVTAVRRLRLGERVVVKGPGVLAFDGDRERWLASGQEARLRVVREGPLVVDVGRALTRAAREGVFLDRSHWHDGLDLERTDLDCC
jgi:hypothetical protein